MPNETAIRLGSFAAIFIVIALWEIVAPRRRLVVSKLLRWRRNFGITAINPLIIRGVFPVLPASMAMLAQAQGWGLLNNIAIPYWLSVIASVILLDLAIYVQHVMFHRLPTFWRLHMMHHTDLDLDVTSGLRFHPLEMIISLAIKLAIIAVLGPPALGVILFEIILNGVAMFNHGNITVPSGIDQLLRLFIVTPDMHRVHHSVIIRETNSNYGFNLSCWDRIFGTYIAQPDRGHTTMTIGLANYRSIRELTFLKSLLLPVRKETGIRARNN